MKTSLSLTQEQHHQIQSHLFPGDGKEAAALLLCGRRCGVEKHRLMVHQVIVVPYEVCTRRSPQSVSWPTSFMIPYLQKAEKERLALIKIHSHPTGYPDFSATDDAADAALFPCIYGWTEDTLPHGSAVMLPDGRIFGRIIDKAGRHQVIQTVWRIGDKITLWTQGEVDFLSSEAMSKNLQAFGEATYKVMEGLTIAVVGCSGTGSIVIEALMRHGVGHLIIVDPDDLEIKNLNRILNTVTADVGKPKVQILGDYIKRTGLGTAVTILHTHIGDIRAIRAVAEADIIFGCVDSVDGRYLLNRIATFYQQPYFDVGVKLEADGQGGVTQVCGNIHYLRPGKSSLKTRGVFNGEELRSAMLKRFSPVMHAELVESKYIKGAQENRPAVITLNMNTASLAVIDFLSRIHHFRHDPEECARIAVSHTAGFMRYFTENEVGTPDEALRPFVGRGDMKPILQLPALHHEENAA